MLGIKTFSYDDDTEKDIEDHREFVRSWYIQNLDNVIDDNGVVTIERIGAEHFGVIIQFRAKLKYLLAIVVGEAGVIKIEEIKNNHQVEALLESAKLAAKHLGLKITEFRFDSSKYPSDGFEVADSSQIISEVDHGVLESGGGSMSIDGLSFYDILVEPDIEIVYWRNG